MIASHIRVISKVQVSTKSAVIQFYKPNSVELPDQKGVSKKMLKNTWVLEKPVTALRALFLKDHPRSQIQRMLVRVL